MIGRHRSEAHGEHRRAGIHSRPVRCESDHSPAHGPRMACACCEKIVQAPLPSRLIERGRPGAGLLAQCLSRSMRITVRSIANPASANGKVSISIVQPWPDRVGRSTSLLEPPVDAIARHVRAGQAIFADDTPLKMQAKGKCATARIWTYVRDERPWGGADPPAAYRRSGPGPLPNASGAWLWARFVAEDNEVCTLLP